MLLVARVARSDCRTPARGIFSGFAARRDCLLRLRPGSTSDRRISEALESSVSSSSCSSSSSLLFLVRIGCRVERRVGCCIPLRGLPLPFRPPSSESSSSSLVESAIRSLISERSLDGFPRRLPRPVLCGRRRGRPYVSEASSSCSSSSDDDMGKLVISTNPSTSTLVFWLRSLMSASSLESLCGWNDCSASGPPRKSRSSSKVTYRHLVYIQEQRFVREKRTQVACYIVTPLHSSLLLPLPVIE